MASLTKVGVKCFGPFSPKEVGAVATWAAAVEDLIQAVADSSSTSSVIDTEQNPLKGITSSQRDRNRNIGDVLNIGSGTRCTQCGFLHFMWRATCGSCEKPMEYNLGDRDEKNRL